MPLHSNPSSVRTAVEKRHRAPLTSLYAPQRAHASKQAPTLQPPRGILKKISAAKPPGITKQKHSVRRGAFPSKNRTREHPLLLAFSDTTRAYRTHLLSTSTAQLSNAHAAFLARLDAIPAVLARSRPGPDQTALSAKLDGLRTKVEAFAAKTDEFTRFLTTSRAKHQGIVAELYQTACSALGSEDARSLFPQDVVGELERSEPGAAGAAGTAGLDPVRLEEIRRDILERGVEAVKQVEREERGRAKRRQQMNERIAGVLKSFQ